MDADVTVLNHSYSASEELIIWQCHGQDYEDVMYEPVTDNVEPEVIDDMKNGHWLVICDGEVKSSSYAGANPIHVQDNDD